MKCRHSSEETTPNANLPPLQAPAPIQNSPRPSCRLAAGHGLFCIISTPPRHSQSSVSCTNVIYLARTSLAFRQKQRIIDRRKWLIVPCYSQQRKNPSPLAAPGPLTAVPARIGESSAAKTSESDQTIILSSGHIQRSY